MFMQLASAQRALWSASRAYGSNSASAVMRAYGSSVYDKLADLCDICAMEVDTPDGMISAEVRA